jgi:DUF971 family protein
MSQPANSASPWPVEIKVRQVERRLDVAFDNGDRFEIPAGLLRVMTPSAEARGHGPAMADPKPIAEDKSGVAIAAVTPIGRYAIRVAFDDGHDTGLYTWATLHRIGRDRLKLEAEHRALLAGGPSGHVHGPGCNH